MRKEINKYEGIEDAIQFAIRSSNKQMKIIATQLWPSLNPERAHVRFLHSINTDYPEKFSADEIIMICQICERYDPIYYMCDETLLERPHKRCIEDEHRRVRDMLEETISQVTKSYQQFMNLMEKKKEIDAMQDNGVVHLLDREANKTR